MKKTANNKDIPKLIGIRIREKRKNIGMSQEEFAEKSGLHPTYISHLETGKANPSLRILLTISDNLETDIVELIRGDVLENADNMLLDLAEILSEANETTAIAITAVLEGLLKAYKK